MKNNPTKPSKERCLIQSCIKGCDGYRCPCDCHNPKTSMEFEKKLLRLMLSFSGSNAQDKLIKDYDYPKMLAFIKAELLANDKQAYKRGVEDCIKLSDKIERGADTNFEEWKAFKRFRNTMRDSLLERKK